MTFYLCQDPAGDAGRRAALAGLPREACPYPAETMLAARWLAGWESAVRAKAEAPVVPPRKLGSFTAAETAQVELWLSEGKTPAEMASLLPGRSKHAVDCKIGRLLSRALTAEEDATFAALLEGGKSLGAIKDHLGVGRESVVRAMDRLGLKPNGPRRDRYRRCA